MKTSPRSIVTGSFQQCPCRGTCVESLIWFAVGWWSLNLWIRTSASVNFPHAFTCWSGHSDALTRTCSAILQPREETAGTDTQRNLTSAQTDLKAGRARLSSLIGWRRRHSENPLTRASRASKNTMKIPDFKLLTNKTVLLFLNLNIC